MGEPIAPAAEISISAADVRDFPYPSPECGAWVREMYGRGRLGVLVRAVLLAHQADSVTSAIGYLCRSWQDRQDGPTKVTVEDLTGAQPRAHYFNRLQTLIGQAVGRSDPRLLYGLISHQAIFDFLTGRLKDRPVATSGVHAQSAFWEDDALASSGQAPETVWPPSRQGELELGLNSAAARRQLYTERCQRLYRVWQRAVRELGPNPNLQPRLRTLTLMRLLDTTHGLFGKHFRRLHADDRDPNRQWQMLSYLSWASLLANGRPAERILFREIPVINARHRIGGGRIDAIEVTAINGRRVRPRERRILAGLAEERYYSAGHLVQRLRTVFQVPLELMIIDWKFLVGDLVQNDLTTVIPDISSRPLPDHQAQMRRYLTLIPFDYHLATQQGQLWELGDVTLRGEIQYILPTQPMVIHPVSMTGDERRLAFTETVAMAWPATQRRAIRRQATAQVYSDLISRLSPPKNGNGHGHGHPNGRADQPELFSNSARPAYDLIEAHRRAHPMTVDPHGILEVLSQDRRGQRIGLRFDKLLAAIHRGDVPPPRTFNPERGGHVACLFPQHQDSTPSFHLRLDRKTFFCFGCERGGEIIPESIPDGYGGELRLDMDRLRSGSAAKRQSAQTGWADDEHHRVMTAAQELLAASLPDSSGARYLTKVRALDLDLAIRFGAGFGTDRLINGLLSLGLGLDELRYYGFVGFSDKVSSRGGIVPLLRRRGMADKHMARPTKWSTRKQEVLGMPYSVLQSRVTFPLGLHGRLNNIYGRSVNPCDKQFTHRKLSIEGTRVAQGGFHMDLLTSNPAPSEVLITEGAIDAISLVALGYPNVIAMIGVANRVILEALAGFGGNYAIAFDCDPNQTGQTKTEKLAAGLRARGFRGLARDFTAEFMAAHPGQPFKDYNQFLVDRQHAPSK